MEFRVLTLWQPWASLIALRLKGYETRSWGTAYQGKLVIHAAQRRIKNEECSQMYSGYNDPLWKALCEITANPHYGCIVAVTNLVDTWEMIDTDKTGPVHLHPHLQIAINSVSSQERRVGDWQCGRIAWELKNIIALPTPIPYKGGQGLRRLQDEAITQQLESLILSHNSVVSSPQMG